MDGKRFPRLLANRKDEARKERGHWSRPDPVRSSTHVAVILREIGCDERTIADALGQETIEMARHYAKGADLKPKMRGVVKRFDEELDKRKTKIVKPAS
jgi:hypothetical protein